MSPDAAFALEISAVLAIVVLIVAIVVVAASSDDYAGAAVHDVEGAQGAITIVTTYAQAAACWKNRKGEGKEEAREEEQECCVMCLTEYTARDEVQVVAACGHFVHAECRIEEWFRVSPTCPVCRGGVWPLLECPPMPPRERAASRAVGVM